MFTFASIDTFVYNRDMPRHIPIKFEKTLEPKIIKEIVKIIDSNKTAKTILNATLAIIATGGILTCAAIAPNATGTILKMIKGHKQKKREQYRQMWRCFNYLKKKRILEFVREEDDGLVYRLSSSGKNRVRKFMIDELTINEPEDWDGKWRLITFDIPERHRQARQALAKKLKETGFYQCQKSVWVHPFPCDEEIEFLKDVFGIHPFIKIFEVNQMTDGKTLHYFQDILSV